MNIKTITHYKIRETETDDMIDSVKTEAEAKKMVKEGAEKGEKLHYTKNTYQQCSDCNVAYADCDCENLNGNNG